MTPRFEKMFLDNKHNCLNCLSLKMTPRQTIDAFKDIKAVCTDARIKDRWGNSKPVTMTMVTILNIEKDKKGNRYNCPYFNDTLEVDVNKSYDIEAGEFI
jgi:hypothetical protein